jgi:hypothetical protein
MARLLGPLLVLLLAVAAARAASDEDGAPDARSLFARGRLELAAGGGYGVFNDRSYVVLIGGGGYYLRDGLSAGLTGEAWLGSRPSIGDVSPALRYIFLDSAWRYKPYAGIFYRRTFYSRGLSPLNSFGGRAGLVFPLNPRAYLTGGAAYEHYADCDKSVYSSCDDVYPEVTLAFGF